MDITLHLSEADAARLWRCADGLGLSVEEFVMRAADEKGQVRRRDVLALALLDDLAKSDIKRTPRRRWATTADLP